jgi:hypothetical protein
MTSRLTIFWIILAVLCAAGEGQAWNYHQTYSDTADSFFADADGNANTWADNQGDSAHWQCVNEAAENSADYVYYSTATVTDEWFQVSIDTTESYDSLRFIVYSLASSGTKDIAIWYKRTDEYVLDTATTGDGVYAKTTSRSVDVSGWSNRSLDSLEIGMNEFDGVPSLGYVRVDWYFVEAWRTVASDDSTHTYYVDSTDCWGGQLTEWEAKDDNWGGGVDSLGAVGDSEFVLIYRVDPWSSPSGSIFEGVPDCGGAEDIDSVFLRVPILSLTGNAYHAYCDAILYTKGIGDTIIDRYHSTGFQVGYSHPDWTNRNTGGPTVWGTAGIKGGDDFMPLAEDTVYDGYQMSFDVTSVLHTMVRIRFMMAIR